MKTIIIEDDFRQTRRTTQAYWRMSRSPTKYGENQTDKNVEFLLKISITLIVLLVDWFCKKIQNYPTIIIIELAIKSF